MGWRYIYVTGNFVKIYYDDSKIGYILVLNVEYLCCLQLWYKDIPFLSVNINKLS